MGSGFGDQCRSSLLLVLEQMMGASGPFEKPR
jgi:hypothetical protein